MMDFLKDLDVITGSLLGVAALLGVLGFKRWGVPPIVRAARAVGGFFRGITALATLPEFMPLIRELAAMDARISRIHMEVLPNGGSSLRDAVNRTSETVKRTETALTLFINSSRAQWDGMGMFAVFECTPNGEYAYTNSVYQRWTNRTDAYLFGNGWLNCVAADDRLRVRKEWESCVQDCREFVMSFKMHGAAGDLLDVTCTAAPVTESVRGPVAKWVGVIRRNTPGGH